MPWDNENDDDLDWVKKHLESRLRFYNDIKRNNIHKKVALHIRMKLFEARYIQERCDYLELGLNDDDDDDDNTSSKNDSDDDINEDKQNLSKAQITDLMKLHLRMSMIRNEIELLENPDMRKVYEDMFLNDGDFFKKSNFQNMKSFDDQINGSFGKIQDYNYSKLDVVCPVIYFISTLNTVTEQINLLEKVKNLIDNTYPILMLNSLQVSK